jgi:hypothetical protein
MLFRNWSSSRAASRADFSGGRDRSASLPLIRLRAHWASAKGTLMALTGQYQFRKTFGGKVVLQVEEEAPTVWSWFGQHRTKKRWRDATLMDLSAPALRILLNWRFKPHSLTRVDVERTSSSAERAYSAAALKSRSPCSNRCSALPCARRSAMPNTRPASLGQTGPLSHAFPANPRLDQEVELVPKAELTCRKYGSYTSARSDR